MKRMMNKSLHICLATFSGLLLTISTSCNSSSELLYPSTQKYTKRQGNIKFIEDLSIAPNNSKEIKVVSGENKVSMPDIPDELLEKYASMMGLLPRAMSNYILYNFIDEWYGVRYRYGGTDKNGIDCSAFVQKLYEDVFNTELVRTARQQFHSCKMIWDIDNLKEGDLVFFKTRGKRISHVGIYLANDFFVHASSSSGVMISNLKDAYWSTRYAGAGKIPRGTGEKQYL